MDSEFGDALWWSEQHFSAMVEDNFQDIWRYAYHRVGSQSDADDLVAEVFSVAWRRREDMPKPPAGRLWLYGVARRALSEQRRSHRRRENLKNRLRVLRSPERYSMTERSPDLLRALDRLDDDDRAILLLRAWDGLAVADIADLYSCTSNAMNLRLRKARQRLAATLEQTDLVNDGHLPVDLKLGKEPHG